jgi:hypothetical protein
VAILSTGSFDATTVDPTSVRFGVTGTEDAPRKTALEDVDHDGRADLILHFATQDTGMTCTTQEMTLTGTTTTGQPVEGHQTVRPVGCTTHK